MDKNELIASDSDLLEWLKKSCISGAFCRLTDINKTPTYLEFPNREYPLTDTQPRLMGFTPINILVSLMHDTVLCDDNMDVIRKHRRCIRRFDGREEKSGRCFYYMYHWGFESVAEGIRDFIQVNRRCKLLSPATCHHIKWLARSILEKILTIPGEINNYNIYPGILWTEKAYHQQPHLDRDENMVALSQQSLIVHLPLTVEGMLLCVWNQMQSPKMLHTPFGCYSVFKNRQVHAGCYGKKGNVRFHIVIRHKSTEQTMEKDKLISKERYRMLTDCNWHLESEKWNGWLKNFTQILINKVKERNQNLPEISKIRSWNRSITRSGKSESDCQINSHEAGEDLAESTRKRKYPVKVVTSGIECNKKL